MYTNTDAPLSAPQQFLLGARYFKEGLTLLARQRRLWLPSLAPLLLTLVMLTGLALFFAWVVGNLLIGLAGLLAALAGQPQTFTPQYRLTLQFWSFLLGLFFASAFYLPLARLLLAPFSERLCRKTHELTRANVPYQSELGWAELSWARAMWEGLKLVSLQLLVTLLALALSFGLPGIGHLFFGAVTLVMCGLDYLDVPLSARGLPLREKLALLWQHKALACGFAAAGYVLLFIPVINLLSLPVGVIGATLLTDQMRTRFNGAAAFRDDV